MVLLIVVITTGCGQQSINENSNKEPSKNKLIGFANLSDSIAYCIWVKEGIITEAKKAGYDIICVDNKSDGATAVKNADILISLGVDIVIEYQAYAAVAPTIMDKFNNAGIPVIAVDIVHPGAIYFGGNNELAGEVGGRLLGQKAKQAWNGQVDQVMIVETASNGEISKKRMGGFLKGIREFVDIPDNRIIWLDGNNDPLQTKARVTDALTAHPEGKHILIACLQDDETGGALAAVETSNRQENVFISGTGTFASTLTNFYGKRNCWIGSVEYGGPYYGQHIIPLVTKILKGEKVPRDNFVQHFIIDYDNISEFYPRERWYPNNGEYWKQYGKMD